MKMNKLNLQIFAEENLTKVGDILPEISIDHSNKFAGGIKTLQKVLGITSLKKMTAGTSIKIYKFDKGNNPEQVGEGEKIKLTEFKRTLDRTIELTLKKHRKETSAEEIQKVGKEAAVNETDELLIKKIQKQIRDRFFSVLLTGTGSATGTGLQSTLAQTWGQIQKVFVDEDVTPIYFVSSEDVADYLGTAQVTMQNAFGWSYIENFLGLGTVVVSPVIAKGKVFGTAKENLFGAYAPANTGDVASSFGLKADATGLVGMKHYIADESATIGTLAMEQVVFYPELLDGVIVGTIGTGA